VAKLSAILDQIDAGTMLLPEFQRGYVWNRDQVRGLMRSLCKGYPVGALLVWETDTTGQAVRGAASTTGTRSLLLDGQQRVTTLYGIVRGCPPTFFDGDPDAFRDLRFNVETEAFEFYGPVKMKDDPRWIDVTALFVDGTKSVFGALAAHPETRERFAEYVERVQLLRNVVERDFHIETITGVDKTVDVVVDIFNRVNSGGTKLSKGDLALARICSEWADARPTMRRNLDRWADRGLRFTPDWLLRNVNALATGRAPFSALEDVSAGEFADALYKTLHNVDHLLDLVSARLGLDHDRVLMGRYAFPVLGRLLHAGGGRFADAAEADRALCWYVHAAVRARFTGPTETMLAKDLQTADREGIDGLITSLRRARKGALMIDPQDFEGAGRGSRAYPLLYLVIRACGARDLVTGRPVGADTGAAEVHEIFPRSLLAKAGYGRAEINAVANYAFVAPSSATALADREPGEYLATLAPDVRASQWIPEGPWRLDRYAQFLVARRKLLSGAANEYLGELMSGTLPAAQVVTPVVVTEETAEPDARAAQIAALVEELAGLGYARPALDEEIADAETGRVLAVAEAFWAEGLQAGQGKPVVLELDPEEADIPRLTELGCEVFTSVDALRGYVQRLGEVASGERTAISGLAEPEEPDADPVPDGALEKALFTLIERCKSEIDYHPLQLREMAHAHGALGAVRRLVNAPTPSDGFVRLWNAGRLDLTVEALVLEFPSLFSDSELDAARRRLDDVRPAMSGRN
jgi:Protein of unknown function DUF262